MLGQSIEIITNEGNFEILTPHECELLWIVLAHHWIDRSDNYLETKAIIDRLYRRSKGLKEKDGK